jgi:SAM-dependent methyltransferase
MVRAWFLASAVRLDLFAFLDEPRSLVELADRVGATRTDLLEAWLAVGVAVRELRFEGRYRVRGRRARALAAGDPVLAAHYRSMLDYQAGPYDDLAELLVAAPGEGRDDLDRHAALIAVVSRAAAPFVTPLLARAVAERRPGHVLDLGCGTGVYLRSLLELAPEATGVGVELAADVAAEAQAALDAHGLGDRGRVVAGDAREFLQATADRYELVTLLNNVYYFDPSARVRLYEAARTVLTDDGELLIATMITPGSPASTHLNLMLVAQSGPAVLPVAGEVESDLRRAGFGTVESSRLVPGEPFVGIRARR